MERKLSIDCRIETREQVSGRNVQSTDRRSGVKKMNPKIAIERISTLIRVWSTMRPTVSFSGYTLEGYKAAAQPSFDARTELDAIDASRSITIAKRDGADAVSLDLHQR